MAVLSREGRAENWKGAKGTILQCKVRLSAVLCASTVVLVAVLIVAGWTAVDGAYRPRLVADASVAQDLHLVADQTWDQFMVAFSGRKNCFGDVALQAAYGLDSRATYDPAVARVTVRVPGTEAMLKGALVHEWAHHIEFQCADHVGLRPAFLRAQGLPSDTAWRPHDRPAEIPASLWAEIPSEQCAEAAVAYVLGSRQIPTNARFTQEAVAVLGQWAARKTFMVSEGAQVHDQ